MISAIWTRDLERLRDFYETYFAGQANAKYINTRKQFQSYFLIFADGLRPTGDGYSESVVLDPKGNRIEITL